LRCSSFALLCPKPHRMHHKTTQPDYDLAAAQSFSRPPGRELHPAAFAIPCGNHSARYARSTGVNHSGALRRFPCRARRRRQPPGVCGPPRASASSRFSRERTFMKTSAGAPPDGQPQPGLQLCEHPPPLRIPARAGPSKKGVLRDAPLNIRVKQTALRQPDGEVRRAPPRLTSSSPRTSLRPS
jgi:hypothetical protein